MSRLQLSKACWNHLNPFQGCRSFTEGFTFARHELPVIGAIPPAVPVDNPKFWLDINLDRVPDRFKPGQLRQNIESLPYIFASFRQDLGLRPGSRYSRRLRSHGFIPGLLDSLPVKQAPIQLVHAKGQIESLVRAIGTNILCQLSILHIVDPAELAKLNRHEYNVREMLLQGWQPKIYHSFQVLPRRLHHNHVVDTVLGVTFMNCPSHRIVECLVPVLPMNADESPSAKRGGYPLITRRFLKVRSLAINIPQSIDIDCSTLETGQKVLLRDVALGQGQHIVGTAPEACLVVMETSG